MVHHPPIREFAHNRTQFKTVCCLHQWKSVHSYVDWTFIEGDKALSRSRARKRRVHLSAPEVHLGWKGSFARSCPLGPFNPTQILNFAHRFVYEWMQLKQKDFIILEGLCLDEVV
jgi:hypothetical protein